MIELLTDHVAGRISKVAPRLLTVSCLGQSRVNVLLSLSLLSFFVYCVASYVGRSKYGSVSLIPGSLLSLFINFLFHRILLLVINVIHVFHYIWCVIFQVETHEVIVIRSS